MSLYVDGNKCQRYKDKICGLCTFKKSGEAASKTICSWFIEANIKSQSKRRRRYKNEKQ